MKIAEIFESFAGEVNGHHQGRISTFLRISGCNLKCRTCDTASTQDPNYGVEMSVDEIVQSVSTLGHRHICLTGGEPLLYKAHVRVLLYSLWSKGYKISVETNGTMDITPFHRYVDSFVIDYKMFECPKVMDNYFNLRPTDVIKFVVESKEEAIQAFYIKESLEKNYSGEGPIFAFSPITPGISAFDLSKLLLRHKVRNCVLSLQIHKYIGFK